MYIYTNTYLQFCYFRNRWGSWTAFQTSAACGSQTSPTSTTKLPTTATSAASTAAAATTDGEQDSDVAAAEAADAWSYSESCKG